ncbi:hypothetical protein BOTBODRAFT_33119 [Botryobasidium botryosum FD-172 SS1]|uniref:Uncharacterized protein n=1 Tax=Botryobasidium botryosum (strain FD-172 SS1) TaxID=930990 RepID=A0A067ME17_BOTB1|nr:hypothetical protein BOTBODRAFT_33119 [Botryobasidium botryosum FD-172 SS1]
MESLVDQASVSLPPPSSPLSVHLLGSKKEGFFGGSKRTSSRPVSSSSALLRSTSLPTHSPRDDNSTMEQEPPQGPRYPGVANLRPLPPQRLAQLANAFGVSTPLPADILRPATTLSTAGSSTARTSTATRFLLHVVPPAHLPSDAPNAPASASGYHTQFRRGTLIPLYSSLQGQLGAIAREYGLPSTGGMVVYLLDMKDGDEGVEDFIGPRISSEAWHMLWNRVINMDREETARVLGLPSSIRSTTSPTPASVLGTPQSTTTELEREAPSRTQSQSQSVEGEIVASPASEKDLSPSNLSKGEDHDTTTTTNSTSNSPSTSASQTSNPAIPIVPLRPLRTAQSTISDASTPNSLFAHRPSFSNSSRSITSSPSTSVPSSIIPSLPVVGKIEFDIDTKKAPWYEHWCQRSWNPRLRNINGSGGEGGSPLSAVGAGGGLAGGLYPLTLPLRPRTMSPQPGHARQRSLPLNDAASASGSRFKFGKRGEEGREDGDAGMREPAWRYEKDLVPRSRSRTKSRFERGRERELGSRNGGYAQLDDSDENGDDEEDDDSEFADSARRRRRRGGDPLGGMFPPDEETWMELHNAEHSRDASRNRNRHKSRGRNGDGDWSQDGDGARVGGPKIAISPSYDDDLELEDDGMLGPHTAEQDMRDVMDMWNAKRRGQSSPSGGQQSRSRSRSGSILSRPGGVPPPLNLSNREAQGLHLGIVPATPSPPSSASLSAGLPYLGAHPHGATPPYGYGNDGSGSSLGVGDAGDDSYEYADGDSMNLSPGGGSRNPDWRRSDLVMKKRLDELEKAIQQFSPRALAPSPVEMGYRRPSSSMSSSERAQHLGTSRMARNGYNDGDASEEPERSPSPNSPAFIGSNQPPSPLFPASYSMGRARTSMDDREDGSSQPPTPATAPMPIPVTVAIEAPPRGSSLPRQVSRFSADSTSQAEEIGGPSLRSRISVKGIRNLWRKSGGSSSAATGSKPRNSVRASSELPPMPIPIPGGASGPGSAASSVRGGRHGRSDSGLDPFHFDHDARYPSLRSPSPSESVPTTPVPGSGSGSMAMAMASLQPLQQTTSISTTLKSSAAGRTRGILKGWGGNSSKAAAASDRTSGISLPSPVVVNGVRAPSPDVPLDPSVNANGRVAPPRPPRGADTLHPIVQHDTDPSSRANSSMGANIGTSSNDSL